MRIVEQHSCGLDVGTSSVGWGLIDVEQRMIPPRLVAHRLWRDGRVQRVEEAADAAGVIKFDPVERKESNKWVSRSSERGVYRRARKRVQRKQWRLEAIAGLFHARGLIATGTVEELFHIKGVKQERPSSLRERALREILTGEDLFRSLYHIAAHRAFEANSKAGEDAEIAAIGDNIETGQPKKKGKKGEKAVAFGDGLSGLTGAIDESGLTPAEYFNRHFTKEDARHRALGGRYDRIFKRHLLVKEVKRIFEAQRQLGNTTASVQLEEEYAYLAFYVKQGQDSEKFVGDCSFAQGADGKPLKRAPRFAPSYERFRFLDKLSSLRLADGSFPTAEQRERAAARFGEYGQFTWLHLAEAIGIDPEMGFKQPAKDMTRDFAMGRGECALGTATLLDALAGLDPSIDQLDLIARKLTHFADIRSITAALEDERNAGRLPHALVERTIKRARTGVFKFFKGTGNISIEAAQKLSAQLLSGKSYTDACLGLGWRHEAPENSIFASLANKRPASPKDILAILNDDDNPPVRSPGARKALTAAFKQFVAITREIGGLPGTVQIELARDIGKSLEERTKADKGRKEGEARNNRMAALFEEVVGRPPRPGSEDMLRFRLWREQRCECPYRSCREGNGYISPELFREDRLGDGTLLNIDHILPWSWSHDDSFENLVLCFAGENARKGSRTPWEYFSAVAPDKWETLKAWVNNIPALRKREQGAKGTDSDEEPGMGGYKRRNLLVEDEETLARLKDRLSRRHLNDTRHATRVLAQAIQCLYPVEYHRDRSGKEVEKRRVLARPGQLVGMMRCAWGMNRLKFDGNGQRSRDERNHAADALIGAAISERSLQQLTAIYQQQEAREGRMGRALSDMPPPWPSFARDVEKARDTVFVVRTERRRARGKLHDAGLFGGGPSKGRDRFHRKLNIEKEFGIDKGKFNAAKASEQLATIKDPNRNRHIIEALENWIAKPELRQEGKWATDQRGQVIRKITVEAASRKPGIEVHCGDADRQTMVRVDVFAIGGAKRGTRWDFVPIYLYQILDKTAFPEPPQLEGYPDSVTVKFAFSLSKGDYIEMARDTGECFEGYYLSFDISTSKLRLYHHCGIPQKIEAAAKTMLTINKYQVDRLGGKSLVRNEVRTWHGVACTSPSPPG